MDFYGFLFPVVERNRDPPCNIFLLALVLKNKDSKLNLHFVQCNNFI